VATRKEVARISLGVETGRRLIWSANERIIGIVGRFERFYHWKSGTIVAAPMGLDIYKTWLDLKSDIKILSLANGQMQAFRLSTGNPIPVRWRWQKDRFVGPQLWSLALQPVAPRAKGTLIHAAILEGEPIPTPRPTPQPTPTPTSTPTVEQSDFLRKEALLYEKRLN
jgi:hypothetical protein